MTAFDAPVGIVGAGPVGLIAALRLASLGVPSVLLEADDQLVKQGSKACLIQGDVLEILDKVGCARTIAEEGVTWTVGWTYVRNQQIRAFRYPRGLGFGPFVNISQYRIEQVLAEAAAAERLCDLRWGHRVTSVSQDEDSVLVRTGEGEYRFAYLVACDGVRSGLRADLGVGWTGYTHGDRFLITDIRAKLPLAQERHFHYDPGCNPGRQLVMHPQPNDIWRIDWQLAPDADIDAERADGRFDRRVRDVIGDIPYEVDWVSTYRFQQRVVDRLVVGRVLFAGDAAHALPPYGSRGMNSGIQDADNLAWKLASVVTGVARTDLVDTYHVERHAAAEENLRVTEATLRFMVPPNLLSRWTRAVLLKLSRRLGAARRHVNSGRMAEPYTYTASPIVHTGHPMLGMFAPDAWLQVDGVRTRLRTLLGAGFVGLVFASSATAAARFGTEPRDGSPTAALVVVLPRDADADGVPAGITVATAEDDEPLLRYRGEAGPVWWLVRPDGHLAARGEHPAEFTAALRQCSLAVQSVSSKSVR